MDNTKNETTKDPKQRAEELLDSLRKGKSTYDLFANTFRTQYLIAGKTIESWEKEFKISIPADLDPNRCKGMDATLMRLYQEALFHKSTARAVLQALKRGVDTELNSRKTAIVAEYETTNRRAPAASTLESLARTQIDDVDGAVMSATIAHNFWEDILEHLSFCRKLIENITINSGIEAKMK
jgi:hypothetical protein